MIDLSKKIKFGKWLQGGGEYLGRTLKQKEDFSIEVSFKRYVDERLSPIKIDSHRKKQLNAALTDKEQTQLKAAGGAALWVGREGRPDCGAGAALVTLKVHEDREYRVSDLVEANKVINELKATADAFILIRPVPLEHLAWAVVSDASSLNLPDGRSQGGFLIGITTKNFLDGELDTFDIVKWASKRVRRTVRASLGSEALALDDGLAEVEWLRATWSEMMDPTMNMRDDTLYGKWDTVAVVRHLGAPGSEPPTAMVVDAKGLFDHLARPSATAGSHERRTLVDIKVMTHSVKIVNGKIRWVPGEIMASDALTKRLGNGALLRHVMVTGTYGISEKAMKMILAELGTNKQRENAAKKMNTHAEGQQRRRKEAQGGLAPRSLPTR